MCALHALCMDAATSKYVTERARPRETEKERDEKEREREREGKAGREKEREREGEAGRELPFKLFSRGR